ncbi:hypothetical protein Tco_1208804 [Tanacetum coccineum]
MEVLMDGEDESLDTDYEREGLNDEDRGLDDAGHSLDEEGLGLEGVIRRLYLRVRSGKPQLWRQLWGSGSVPEPERPERVSAFRQPTLSTWIDLEDGITYIDVFVYPPPAPPAQAPPSPEWSCGSLPISLAPSAVPSPIPSPMISSIVLSPIASPVATPTATIFVDEDQFIKVGAQLELYEGILQDHTQCLDAMPPILFADIDRDVRELYTRSGVVIDEIFLQRYRFRSLELEQERTAVTFGALWRPVLALEA